MLIIEQDKHYAHLYRQRTIHEEKRTTQLESQPVFSAYSFILYPIYLYFIQFLYSKTALQKVIQQQQPPLHPSYPFSMQLQQLASFKQPQTQQTKTSYLNDKGKSKIQKPIITCAQYTSQNQTLTCGLSDGSIIQFVNQKFNNKKLTESKDFQVRKFCTLQNIHKGEIKCLLAQKIFNQIFVITGSADRTVKIWDTQIKTKAVVQTLTGHTGTVLALAYSRKSDTLFTASVDKTVRIWKQDEGRKFFMYPWYVSYQIISDFIPKKPTQHPVYPTTFQLIDGQVNTFVLYLGDSAGNLHILRQYQIEGSTENQQKSRTGFEIQKSNYKHHRLNINCIKYIPKEHLVVSSGYDQYLYGFQSLSQKLTLKYANPKKCLFTSVVWIHNLLIAADQSGTFYCLQLSSDKGVEEIKKYQCKINQIFVKKDQIFAVTDDKVDVFKVVRGIKTVQGQNCHTDSIIGIYALQAYRLTDKKVKDQVKIISVSLDNSMRVWDPNDLSCLQVMQNPEKAEISSLFYLKRANLFVTGHENGLVRLWNIQLQTSITISQQNMPIAHKNNVCAFTEYIHIRGNQDITQFMFSTGYEGKVNVWQIFLKKSSVQSSLISSSICPQLKNCFFPEQQQQGEDKIGYQLFALQILQRKGGQDLKDAIILSGGTKGILYFTKMFTYQTFKKQQLHDQSILCMMIDQNILFTGSSDHTIRLTNLQNIDHIENLSVLYAHECSVIHMSMLQETGHLISQSSDGQILFWNYTSEKIVKKIKEKKQKIVSLCYVDESQMIYVGTEGAKILTYDISQLYNEPVNNNFTFKPKQFENEELSQDTIAKMMKKNQEQLQKLRKGL